MWEILEKNPATYATIPPVETKQRPIWDDKTFFAAVRACDNDTLRLCILVIDAEKLTSEIKWEDGGGWDFPHIYGLIDEAAAVEVLPHLWSADRVWVPNEELNKYRED